MTKILTVDEFSSRLSSADFPYEIEGNGERTGPGFDLQAHDAAMRAKVERMSRIIATAILKTWHRYDCDGIEGEPVCDCGRNQTRQLMDIELSGENDREQETAAEKMEAVSG